MSYFIRFIMLLAGLAILLTSCFREDEIVPKHQSGNILSSTLELTETYKYQVYYDLSSNQVVASNLKTDWDLAFECSDTGYTVLLNTAKFMRSYNTHLKNIMELFDTSGVAWIFDNPTGDKDSTALGTWYLSEKGSIISKNDVYALDMGMDEEGNAFGGMKIQLADMPGPDTYKIRFARLDNKKLDSVLITKVPGKNYTYYSLLSNQEYPDLEPGQNEWDLLFTQYTTTLYTKTGIATPYLVLGVLINPFRVEALTLKDTLFESINYSSIQSLELSHRTDIIGYNWKRYDFKNGYYEVNSSNTYVIKDTEGYYFKMRFVGFYNNLGEKGFPTIEVQKL